MAFLQSVPEGIVCTPVDAGNIPAEWVVPKNARLAQKAKEAGVDITYEAWQDMIHVWHIFADILPEAREATNAIGKYIFQHTR